MSRPPCLAAPVGAASARRASYAKRPHSSRERGPVLTNLVAPSISRRKHSAVPRFVMAVCHCRERAVASRCCLLRERAQPLNLAERETASRLAGSAHVRVAVCGGTRQEASIVLGRRQEKRPRAFPPRSFACSVAWRVLGSLPLPSFVGCTALNKPVPPPLLYSFVTSCGRLPEVIVVARRCRRVTHRRGQGSTES